LLAEYAGRFWHGRFGRGFIFSLIPPNGLDVVTGMAARAGVIWGIRGLTSSGLRGEDSLTGIIPGIRLS
jgi:hypothetical protein